MMFILEENPIRHVSNLVFLLPVTRATLGVPPLDVPDVAAVGVPVVDSEAGTKSMASPRPRSLPFAALSCALLNGIR